MKKKPGKGFIIMFLTYMTTVMFFSWGWAKPDLERVWEIYHEFRAGKTQTLNEKDKEILNRTLKQYPDLKSEYSKGADTFTEWLQ